MVNHLVFRWPRLYFSMGFGGLMVVGVFVGQNLITFPSFRDIPENQAPPGTPLYDIPRKGLETWRFGSNYVLVGDFNPSEKY